ncbi:nucleotidyltransferase family protein [Paenibacillus timonensis]|uniref:NTP transferase domain-containing protein n=1 Tax=Paenibacillus timonensis TaxID=225915 RepID=A0ABW3S546_9BACL|nr:nucleotidyltransferase family protein [Paenibacillus timonensis]MCH1639486.1 nucleotidyltransferase family protein [Paenibacillus timonensis]
MKVCGIYLAAGKGSRMGGSKVSRELSPGVPLGSVALRELENSGFAPVIVVVRADDPLEWLPPAVVPSLRKTVPCLNADKGLSYSLRCGLNAVMPYEPDAVVIALADQPFVTAALFSRLLETFRRSPELDYVACTYGGVRMVPALFSNTVFPALQRLEGDRGAAGILRSSVFEGRIVEPESSWFAKDVDTEAELREVQLEWKRHQM